MLLTEKISQKIDRKCTLAEFQESLRREKCISFLFYKFLAYAYKGQS